MQSYDLVIIGGGMVGLTLAAALDKQPIKIAVIERSEYKSNSSDQPDLRVSAINLASQNILKNVGAWPAIVQQRLQAFKQMRVWERDSFGELNFAAAAIGQDELGHIVENKVVQFALFAQVKNQENVSLYCPNYCEQILFGEQGSWLTLNNGKHLNAKLVVACDGANSWLRKQANIPVTFSDYGHSALVATVQTELKHSACARQVFSPEGPLAFLPLWQDKLCSIVWSMPPEKATQLASCSVDEFNKALTIAFDHQLGLCSLQSERQVLPLRMRYARSFAKQGLALCGDAAHTIHPLAGLGVNLGLQDAAALSQSIINSIEASENIGSLSQLRSYERWRKAQAVIMISTMQSIKTLFGQSNCVFKQVRTVGLLITDKMFPVKQLLIKKAMGLMGELPELARLKK